MVIQPQNESHLNLGHDCSKIAFAWAKKTFGNCPAEWGGPVLKEQSTFCNILRMGPVHIGISSDGIGTKIELAERTGNYSTLGYDLVAMVADDLVSNGVIPTSISNILDADRLDPKIVDSLMAGLHEAAAVARVCVTGGEIAELGNRNRGYGDGMHFNWCGTGIGFIPPGVEPITGASIEPGDAVVALRSRGFRSNGFSLIRNIMTESFGPHWHRIGFMETRSLGDVLLTPSLIYTPLVVDLLLLGVPLKGIAHVTGGGIPDNLGRILKGKGLGAILDGLFPPHDFMQEIQELGNVPDEEAYHAWNMGNGMLLVMPGSQVDRVVSFSQEHGYTARRAGTIRKGGIIEIVLPRGDGSILKYEKTGK